MTNMNDIVVNTDADNVVYRGHNKNFGVDQYYLLNKYPEYSGIFKKVIDASRKATNWEVLVGNIANVAKEYKILYEHYIKVAEDLIRTYDIDESIKEIFRLIQPLEVNIFTGSEKIVMQKYVEKRLVPIIPKAKLRVFGTTILTSDSIITGEIADLWTSSRRVMEAKKLTDDRVSINIGDSSNDIEMLKAGTLSFFLTDEDRGKEGNIIFCPPEKAPAYLRKYSDEIGIVV